MRPGWDAYYLGVAQAISARGECVRRQIGAVIVKDRAIVATGYNGAAPGGPSCLEGKCPRGVSGAPAGSGYAESGCVALHAETNAMLRADWHRMQGATLYITDAPCVDCWQKLQASGLARVVYPGSGDTHIEWVRP